MHDQVSAASQGWLVFLEAGPTSDLMARRSLKRRSWDEFMPQGPRAVRAGRKSRKRIRADRAGSQPRQLGWIRDANPKAMVVLEGYAG